MRMPLRTRAIEIARERGWTIAEFARRSGLSLRVCYYLRDGRQPSTQVVGAVMKLFPELSFEDLFVPADSTEVEQSSTTEEAAA